MPGTDPSHLACSRRITRHMNLLYEALFIETPNMQRFWSGILNRRK
jgi:hypothetical protein